MPISARTAKRISVLNQSLIDSLCPTLFHAGVAILCSAYQIEKSFASRTLFRDLTFAVESGDRIGLIGPNGSGKSTLMRILAQKTTVDGGKLSFSRGLRVGFLEQSPEFTENPTVYEAITADAPDPYDATFLSLVDQLLSKLELNQATINSDSRVHELSGGWKKRVALARELAKSPDLLLLDEPTNHLDFESILWLEEFLQAAPFAVITVTHDRLFLQRVANRIFDLDRRNPDGLFIIKGDYAQYLEAKAQLMHELQRREDVLTNTLRRETEWLRRGAKARTTKQTARINRAGDIKSEVEDLSERNTNKTIGIEFHEAERNPQKLISAEGLTKAYGDRLLFENLDLLITPKTRLGLLGPNGCGKSTLIRILLGKETPDTGKVVLADKLVAAYFDQHRDELDPNVTVLQTVCPEGDYVEFHGQFVFARSYLDRFLFRSEQMDMPVAKLSGGEQSRLRIAQLMLKPANVLILDEPTNDLDVATLNVLEDNLREFNGAVILVTHDRFFMDQVAKDILAFTKDALGEPELLRFAGYHQWETWIESRPRGGAAKAAAVAAAKEASTGKKKLSYKDKREFEGIEALIQKTEAHLQSLEKESQANTSNAGKLSQLYAEIGKTQSEIEKLYARWSELEALAKP